MNIGAQVSAEIFHPGALDRLYEEAVRLVGLKLAKYLPMKRRILLVDDELQILELLGMFLAQKGFEIFKASSSSQALEVIEHQRVELVLLDIGLAEEDGLKVLPVLKSQRPQLKVVMLTGMGFVEDLLQEAQQKGADGYVSKALPLEEVLEAINQVLSKVRPIQAVA